jgi:hypothetical protein
MAAAVTPTRTDDPAEGGNVCVPTATDCSLRNAIIAAEKEKGTVQLRTPPAGTDTYVLNHGALTIKGPVTIAGVDPRSTIIQQTGSGSDVFEIDAGPTTLNGITIIGAHGAFAHGVDELDPTSLLTLSDVSITGNSAEGKEGFAGSGGGVANDSKGQLMIVDSSVTHNTAKPAEGGSNGEGAGVFGGEGPVTIVNSTIAGNSASSGLNPAFGGGIAMTAGTLELSSVTLAGNASAGVGGNLAVASEAKVTDSIIAGGAAATAGTENCRTSGGGAIHSLGFNLEDRNQCSLGASGDQINANPLLGALQDNGGFGVFTEALPLNSPAVDHGSPVGCHDALGAAVTTDQRGASRGSPCDIGAFEGSYPPTAITSTTISGTPATGHALTCAPASFSGALPITIAYQWLREGAAIPGAVASTYGVSATDADHVLTCVVTATNPDGTVSSRASATVAVLAVLAVRTAAVPIVSSATQSASKWREGNALARITANKNAKKKLPLGTTFSFSLNEPAAVTFTFTQAAAGRRVGNRCIAQTNKNKKKRRCTRNVVAGTLAFSAHAGGNKVRFQGPISKRRKLSPGSYTLLISATASGKQSARTTLHFTIVSG